MPRPISYAVFCLKKKTDKWMFDAVHGPNLSTTVRCLSFIDSRFIIYPSRIDSLNSLKDNRLKNQYHFSRKLEGRSSEGVPRPSRGVARYMSKTVGEKSESKNQRSAVYVESA